MHQKKKSDFFFREKLYVIYIEVRFFFFFWNGIKILEGSFRVYSGFGECECSAFDIWPVKPFTGMIKKKVPVDTDMEIFSDFETLTLTTCIWMITYLARK